MFRLWRPPAVAAGWQRDAALEVTTPCRLRTRGRGPPFKHRAERPREALVRLAGFALYAAPETQPRF